MKTKAVTRESLEALIKSIDDELAAIDEKLGERPEWSTASFEVMKAFRDREEKELHALRIRMTGCMNARFYYQPAHEHRMKLAGISTSSTSGWRHLLRNWQNAARRRIFDTVPAR